MSDTMAQQLSGTPHAGEIPYVFNTLAHARWPMGERDAKVAESTMAYWVAFATDGRLSPAGLPPCPMIDNNVILRIGNDGPVVEADDRVGRYRALAAILDPRS
jgi:para-nitrobenzyl esterase